MDAAPGSPEEEELELFSVLVERYEDEHYPIDLPDPVEAIKFRMEQEELSRKDMRKYLGSQSKVSEILNRKRTLSLSMIRALHDGLGIPAEVLLKEPGRELDNQQYDYRDYPFTEMFNRGYFPSFQGTLYQAKDQAEELLKDLFSVFPEGNVHPVYCRNSDKDVDTNALAAWQARVTTLALQDELPDFSWEALDEKFLREVIKLSYLSEGPRLVREMLNKKGVHLVIEKHLPQTYLDGASFMSPSGRPIISLTLRYDREDNFWFTLAHELGHAYLHLKEDPQAAFFDETMRNEIQSDQPAEQEADHFAKDLLIPPEEWDEVEDEITGTNRKKHIREFADFLRISPAIVAGRIRWETGEYSKFSSLIGNKKIREQFPGYG